MAEESDSKAQLVRETCSISTIFTVCTHRGRSPGGPAFVDWYLILRVDEEAGIEVIRRQYRRLALQLHPDKNSHPKAEAAFKVVSQAYECLTDEARRRAFNSERQEKFCRECHMKSQARLTRSDSNSEKQSTGLQTKVRRALTALREAKKRLQEECSVIESCLKANRGSQSPLFEPSVYLLYPHYRDRVLEKSQEHEQFQSSDGIRNHRSKGRCESPLFEIRTDRRPSRAKNCSFKL